ncbi:MAG: hypothetical protein CL613_03380, partial [Aquimarina sp.]|nr:hypothetical protein [Aquimarina sp.]
MKIVKKLYAGFFICIFLQAVLIVGCSEGKKNAVSYDQVLQELIADEDTDGDKKITIEDKGDKSFGFIDKTGKRIVEMVHEDLTPSKVMTKQAFENAI